MMQIGVTIKGLDEMQSALERFSKRGLAAASRETLTNLAWAARPIWQKELEQAHTLRNTFTGRRVLVAPARGSQMRTMEARLGHTEKYVADLEYGRGGTPRGGSGAVPIPELAARGGDQKRLVGKPNKLSTIGKLTRGRKPRGATYKARNAQALRVAKKAGSKFAVLEGPRSRGIFRVLGGRKKLKVRKVWDLSHRTVSRPRRPTLQRTLDAVLTLGPEIAHRAMTKQLALLGAK
jgi:hypothetical protein